MAYRIPNKNPIDIGSSVAIGVSIPFNTPQVFTQTYTTQDQIRSNIIITDSEILSLDDGLIKKTDTITNPNGIITETVSYSADWTYNAENTVTGKALASGRSALTVRPTFLLTSPVTRQKSTRIIYASYTGGAIVEDVDESTDQTEDYIPSFEHEPMFKEGTNNYHGEAIAQNLYLSTASAKINVPNTLFFTLSEIFCSTKDTCL